MWRSAALRLIRLIGPEQFPDYRLGFVVLEGNTLAGLGQVQRLISSYRLGAPRNALG